MGHSLSGKEKILLVPPFGLGDAVMMLPLACNLKKHYPEIQLDMLCATSNGAAQVIRYSPYVDGIRIFPLQKYSINSCLLFLMTKFLPLIAALRREDYTFILSVDCNPLRKLLIGAIGKSTALLNDRYDQNQIRTGLELLNSFLIKPDRALKNLLVFPESMATSVLRKFDLLGKEYICFNWLGKTPARTWLKMPEIIGDPALSGSENLKVLLGTSSGRKESLSGKGCLDLVNKTDILEAMIIVSRCKLMVTVDGGLMHIATATKRRVIALFGNIPSSYRRPVGAYPDFHAIDSRNPDEIGSIKMEKKSDFPFLEKIPKERVLSLIQEVLKDTRRPTSHDRGPIS